VLVESRCGADCEKSGYSLLETRLGLCGRGCELGGDMGVTVGGWEDGGDMGVFGHCVPDEMQIGTLGDAGRDKSVDFTFFTRAFCFAADMTSGFDFTRLCIPFFTILV
jgi:hypothetical protein